jgi:hypothetical protein
MDANFNSEHVGVALERKHAAIEMDLTVVVIHIPKLVS